MAFSIQLCIRSENICDSGKGQLEKTDMLSKKSTRNLLYYGFYKKKFIQNVILLHLECEMREFLRLISNGRPPGE